MSAKRVIVVGAGLAGLSCAVGLCRRGIAVTLCEAAPHAGGRTRSFSYKGVEIDNGQHLMLSAYARMEELLGYTGGDAGNWLRQAFCWSIYRRRPGRAPDGGEYERFCLDRSEGLLAMLRPLAGQGGALRWWRQARFVASCAAMLWKRPRAGLGALEWLRQSRQHDEHIRLLWEPLCLAALNTPVATASAKCLHAVLARVLAQMTSLDLLFNRNGLSQALVQPCVDFLRRHGASIHTGARIVELLDGAGRGINGVRGADGQQWRGDAVALSLPAAPTRRLLAGEALAPRIPAGLLAALEGLDCSPINTLYLQFAESLGGREALFGFIDEPFDWVIDREITNHQQGLLALVSSARAVEAPIDSLLQPLAAIYGRLPPLLWHKSIVEKCATFLCTSPAQRARPALGELLPGLWLNGDWLANPLPSTIETAIDNGLRCAEMIAERPASGRPSHE